jgi:hypothetical protein
MLYDVSLTREVITLRGGIGYSETQMPIHDLYLYKKRFVMYLLTPNVLFARTSEHLRSLLLRLLFFLAFKRERTLVEPLESIFRAGTSN